MYHAITTQQAQAKGHKPGRISTMRQVPLLIEVQLGRCWWRKRYKVRMRLLNEQGMTLCWTGFVESIQALCTSLGIAETDAVWQHSSLSEEPTQEQEGWTPFLFF